MIINLLMEMPASIRNVPLCVRGFTVVNLVYSCRILAKLKKPSKWGLTGLKRPSSVPILQPYSCFKTLNLSRLTLYE